MLFRLVFGISLAVFIGIADWAAASTGEIEMLFGEVYTDTASGPLKADIYMPPGEGPFPGMLVVHGGGWFVGTRAQLSGQAQLLARQGFTAVAISYRLAPQHKFQGGCALDASRSRQAENRSPAHRRFWLLGGCATRFPARHDRRGRRLGRRDSRRWGQHQVASSRLRWCAV